jgi:uncharacterized protein YggU (UPF0235/DUF167 family)
VVRLTVRAKPRVKTSRILRAQGLSVDVSIAAPPVDGAANDELISVLAEALRLPRKSVRVSLGSASKNKVVDVLGLTEVEMTGRLAAAARP